MSRFALLSLLLLAAAGCRVIAPEVADKAPPELSRNIQWAAEFVDDSLIVSVWHDPSLRPRAGYTVEVGTERCWLGYFDFGWGTLFLTANGRFPIEDSNASTPGNIVTSGWGQLVYGKGRLVTMRVPVTALGEARALRVLAWISVDGELIQTWRGVARVTSLQAEAPI